MLLFLQLSFTIIRHEPYYLKIKPDLETGPWAAEAWKIVNPKTVDITLRSGMRFHDGKPVTVEDVKFTWDYTKKWSFPMYN